MPLKYVRREGHLLVELCIAVLSAHPANSSYSGVNRLPLGWVVLQDLISLSVCQRDSHFARLQTWALG